MIIWHFGTVTLRCRGAVTELRPRRFEFERLHDAVTHVRDKELSLYYCQKRLKTCRCSCFITWTLNTPVAFFN